MTHRTDGVSLAFGTIFLAAATMWLASRLVALDVVTVGWFVVGTSILLGAAGIAGAAVGAARRRPGTADSAVDGHGGGESLSSAGSSGSSGAAESLGPAAGGAGTERRHADDLDY